MDVKIVAKIKKIAALANHAKMQLAQAQLDPVTYNEIMISADALGLSRATLMIRSATALEVNLNEVSQAIASVDVFKKDLTESFQRLPPDREFHKLKPIFDSVYEAVDEISALLEDE